jgi:hypothetical protein
LADGLIVIGMVQEGQEGLDVVVEAGVVVVVEAGVN